MELGKKIWVFPDLDLPPVGDYPMKGHESIVVLNTSNEDAHLKFTYYFTDRQPVGDICGSVGAQRVRCFKTDNREDFPNFSPDRETQYAVTVESDIPVVVQYGRLDTRNQPVAYYTVMGHCQ